MPDGFLVHWGPEAPVPTLAYGFRDLLADAGGAASLVGLWLTFLVFRWVSRVRREFLFAARVPELRGAITQHLRNLEAGLRDGNRELIRRTMAELGPDLRSMAAKLPAAEARDALDLAQRVERHAGRGDATPAAADDLVQRLLGLLGRVRNIEKDRKWSLRDGSE